MVRSITGRRTSLLRSFLGAGQTNQHGKNTTTYNRYGPGGGHSKLAQKRGGKRPVDFAKPLEATTLSEKVYRLLLEQIVCGNLAPGEKLSVHVLARAEVGRLS